MHYLLIVFLFTSFAVNSAITRSFNVTVDIDQDAFKPTYEILGKNGQSLTDGLLTVDGSGKLATVNGVPFTLWEVLPDGSSKRQIKDYSLRFHSLNVAYRGEKEQVIDNSIFEVMIDNKKILLNSIIPITTSSKGYSDLTVKSKTTLPVKENSGDKKIFVSLVGVFENKIE